MPRASSGLWFVACALLLQPSARADAAERALSLNLAGLLTGPYGVRYEQRAGSLGSLLVEVHLERASTTGTSASSSRLAYGATLGYALQLGSAAAPRGLFVAPGLRVLVTDVTTSADAASAHESGVTLLPHVQLGYNAVWENGLSFGVAAGLSYGFFLGDITGTLGGVKASLAGTGVVLALCPGYTW